MSQYEQLARLRPLLPVQALAEIVGDGFTLPAPKLKGLYRNADIAGFNARITADGRIGALSYHKGFPTNLTVEGLQLDMALDAARATYPELSEVHDEETDRARKELGIDAYAVTARDGNQVDLRFRDDKLIGFGIEHPDLVYPAPPNRNATDRIRRAYDLEIQRKPVDRTAPDNHGWVFGLPPGISPEQWPLDPISGYPLMHGFTVLLPDDYRVHGPEIVALSFFATAADQNDGGARVREPLRAAVLGNGSAPAYASLTPFWQHAQSRHPRLHRMKDILDYEYAVVLLTRDEFDGPLCQPPRMLPTSLLGTSAPPEWLRIGAGLSFLNSSGALAAEQPMRPTEEYWSYKLLGEKPDGTIAWHRAIRCTPRTADPNAGLAPEEGFGQPTNSGYVDHAYYEGGEISTETYREHAWAKDHKRDHIGGTMRPVQAMPEFSPYYIAFEEYFGGYNFGAGGNAQLDFLDMKIDWACG